MKEFLSLLLLILVVNVTTAQEKFVRAPLNEQFEMHYLNKSKKSGAEIPPKYSTGYTPSPVVLNFNNSAFNRNTKKSIQELPAKYDLRTKGKVTSVKDQNPLGSCWTFASIGAIESNWLVLGGYSRYSLDLSEENMAVCHEFEWGINDGGNDMIAAAYLTRLDGPATEASDPYSKSEFATCPNWPISIPAYVPTVLWLPSDVEIVKKAILDYGAVTSSIHVDQNPFDGSLLSMNSSDYTFYYGGTEPVNHAVLIVGWDDTKTVTGGAASPGQSTGAWIVKNSWGSSWSDDGYFYVSYEDTRFLNSVSVFPERIPKSEIDTLYMYDRLGMTSSYGYREETASAMAKFTATDENFINKVGTFINSSGAVIDIEIYEDFDGIAPEGLIASIENQFCKFPGYYTFDIPALVNGDYYVKIKYNTPGYSYPIPVESAIKLSGEDYALPEIQDSGYFWVSKTEEEWQALGREIEDSDVDLCIRVYADRNTDMNVFFTANREFSCVNSEIEFTHNSNGEISELEWNFGDGATPETASTAGPHSVKYTTPGLKDVSLTVTGPAGSKTITRKAYIEVVESDLDIFLPYSEYDLIEGKSLPISAFGAETYSWSPSEGLNTSNGSTVIATPLSPVTYTVQGQLGTCSGSASIKINILQNPDNDDICDAFQIIPGGNAGTFSNINATVEDGEPAPDEGECDQPMQWCVEGGLQNSVWFKFTGPENGVVSFDAPGMDNQLAIWKIRECDSIFTSSGRKLIAAFDDYYGEEDFYAAALANVEVIPGEQYFLQVDGSAGGAEGVFSLIFWDYPLSDEEYRSDMENFNNLTVYPNPGNGIFSVKLHSQDFETVNVTVVDPSGKSVYRDEYVNIPGVSYTLYLENLSSGIYFLTIDTPGANYNRNLIIR